MKINPCSVPWCCALAAGLGSKDERARCAVHVAVETFKPADVHLHIDWWAVDDLHGLPEPEQLPEIAIDCKDCRGRGECLCCDGNGTISCHSSRCHQSHTCETCDGEGTCLKCNGSGRVTADGKPAAGDGKLTEQWRVFRPSERKRRAA